MFDFENPTTKAKILDIVKLLLAVLAGQLLSYSLGLYKPFFRLLCETVPVQNSIVLNIALLVLLLIAGSYIKHLHTKIHVLKSENITLELRLVQPKEEVDLTKDYIFEQQLGIYKHKTDDLYYCPSCLIKGIMIPLKERDNGWKCVIKDCGQFFSNPDYIAPTRKISRRGDNYVDFTGY